MPETEGPPNHACNPAPPAEPSRRYGLASALIVFLAIRILILVVAYAAPQDRTDPKRSGLWWWDMPLARWDYGHYMSIMEDGYPRDEPTCERIAFFPGYPLAGRLLMPWLPSHLALPAVSLIASTIAICFVYLWGLRLYGPRVAFLCVLLMSAYPASMFFCAGYADALLLLCVAVAFWCLTRGWIYGAAMASAYATLTRPTGLALATVIFLYAWFNSTQPNWFRRGLRLIPVGLISISGFLAYQGYLWHHYGRPDTFVATQANWGFKKPVPNPLERILTLKTVIQPGLLRPVKFLARGQFDKFRDPLETWNPMFNLIVLVVAIVGLIRPGPIPRPFFLLPILIFLMAWLPDPYRGARMIGIARYHLVAIPVFLTLADWMAKRWPAFARYGLLLGLLALECMYARQFADWRYIG